MAARVRMTGRADRFTRPGRLLVLTAVYLAGCHGLTSYHWADLVFLRAGGVLATADGNRAGLHLLATYPSLQFGPLASLTVHALMLLAPLHLRGAFVVTGLVGLLVTADLLHRAAQVGAPGAEAQRRIATASLFGGSALALSWADLVVGWGHLDDVLVLTFLALAWWAVRCQRPVLVGVALGLGVAAKPTALFALALCLLLVGAWRWRAALLAVLVGGVAFLPYFAAAPGATVAGLLHFHVPVQPTAVLHLVMATGAEPSWVRPAQLVAALAAGWLCLRLGRPECVLLAVAAARLLLDPGAWPYYTAELSLGALVVEQARAPQGVLSGQLGLRPLLPWVLLNFDPFFLGGGPAARLVVILATVALCVGLPVPRLSCRPSPASLATPDRVAAP